MSWPPVDSAEVAERREQEAGSVDLGGEWRRGAARSRAIALMRSQVARARQEAARAAAERQRVLLAASLAGGEEQLAGASR